MRPRMRTGVRARVRWGNKHHLCIISIASTERAARRNEIARIYQTFINFYLRLRRVA